MTHIACVVLAAARRRAQVRGPVLASILGQGFDDIVIVGDWNADGADVRWENYGVRYLCVGPLTHTTTDALVKRDVGTLASNAEVLVYLCDDHALAPGFGPTLREVLDEPWDVLVPNRITYRSKERVILNNGENANYCGGHAGVFRRDVITAKPWAAHAHHRNWDALISAEQIARGARFCWSPRTALHVIDIEPEARPWI